MDGWQPFRVTNSGDSEALQQTDAMCKAFLFDVGLRCPSNSAEGRLGRCFCPWVESVSEKNSSGQPCYAATLAAGRAEWEKLSTRVEEWEEKRRQHATLAGFWDELHYENGEPCLAHPGVADAEFLRDNYETLYFLAESLYARDSLRCLQHMELIASAGAMQRIPHVPKQMSEEASSLASAIAKANEAAG
eukprot:gene7551-18040_t